jgi:fluoride exporter
MWAWVALAGAAGAVARWGVHRVVSSRVGGVLPWGTVTVNIAGSFLFGVVSGLVIVQGVDPDLRTVLGTGFLGSFTTYSAFAYESFALAEDGALGAALGNVAGSVLAGLAAAALGLAVTGAL